MAINNAFVFPGELYAITPDQPDTERLLGQIDLALSHGVRLVQYRDKLHDMPTKLARARALNRLCAQHNARLIINDDLVLALEIGAAGVHLGATDGNLREARRLLPPDSIIGASCYNSLALAQQAMANGASYVAFGACFDSPTKPDAHRVSLQKLWEFRQALGPEVAICGIGGINRHNIGQLYGLVDAVALISELFGTIDYPADDATLRATLTTLLAQATACASFTESSL